MMARLVFELRLFFVALQFLTRVPMPRWVGFEPGWLLACVRHFPAVGACVGACSAGVLAAASFLFPWPVAVLLGMLASIVATGAFHEDGLADTCDALGGAVDRERALSIMKDSRVGTYGAVGLVMALGLKAAALMSMSLPTAMAALLLGHSASRAAAVVLMRQLPYAGDDAQAKARPLAQRVSGTAAAVACGWVAAVAAGLWAWHGPAIAVASSLAIATAGFAGWGCARWWQRRLGGITGDTLGATQQIVELSVLLAVLASVRMAG